MLQTHDLPIAHVRVPAKRARTLDPAKVDELAEDMLENGQKIPIQCRKDPKESEPRYILVEGYHRLEALKALGEETVASYLVQARVR